MEKTEERIKKTGTKSFKEGIEMGERYLVTGTQLGVLISLTDIDERKKIVEDIIDKQFIATSGQPVEADVHNIIKLLR